MSEQEENELICEMVLGWKPHRRMLNGHMTVVGWACPSGHEELDTPSFTTWASAGLILEALAEKAEFPRLGQRDEFCWYCVLKSGVTAQLAIGPTAVRAAALAYLRDGTVPELPKEQDDTL